ncbi:hypothetical protein [Geminicoccus flavidas]|uniref:hypothetical protein n=1 Tax=Geminicoccus flavidas TaxID=2506407 RepID=UPI001359BB27|nr:hypothetical protein [Geminicoccus flavidas]
MADLTTIADRLPELEDRIGLTELRLARLRVLHQRLVDQGQDPTRVEHLLRTLERTLATWRVQRAAWLAEMNGIAAEAAAARPAPLPVTTPPDPWAAELVRLHQDELRRAEQLVAAGQAAVALMDRLLGELRRLQQQVETLQASLGRRSGGHRATGAGSRAGEGKPGIPRRSPPYRRPIRS